MRNAAQRASAANFSQRLLRARAADHAPSGNPHGVVLHDLEFPIVGARRCLREWRARDLVRRATRYFLGEAPVLSDEGRSTSVIVASPKGMTPAAAANAFGKGELARKGSWH